MDATHAAGAVELASTLVMDIPVAAQPHLHPLTSTGSMEVRPVRPGDARTLAVLFAATDTSYFHPHDMTATGAMQIARLRGLDLYLIGWLGSVPVAYGMLRGWDEGYDVPSLGISVRDGYRRRGLGRAMMLTLHGQARARGATQIRLRVAPENLVARQLYDSLGYRVVGMERGEMLMLLDI